MQGTTNQTEARLTENVIDVSYYWNVLRRNLRWILLLALVAGVGSYYVTSQMTPLYRATATLLIENKDNNVVAIEGLYGTGTHAKEYYLTQYEILKSRELADRLLQRLDLIHSPEFDPRQHPRREWLESLPPWLDSIRQWFAKPATPLTDDAVHDLVLSQFNSSLDVEPITNTQLIRINFDAHDPAMAAKIANTLADTYIDSNMDVRLHTTRKAADWLSGQLKGLADKLKDSEARLQAYRDKESLVDVAGVNTLNAQELNELTQRYVAASNTRAQAQILYEQIQAAGPAPTLNDLLELPSIQRDDLVKSLKTAQTNANRTVAELSKRYGPKHPKMIAAQAEADEAHAELTRQVQRVARGIETDYQAALKNEKAIAARMAQTKKEAQNVNRKEFRLSELQREVDTNRQLYDMFLTRAKETGAVGNVESASARIVDPAQPPRVPVAPRVNLSVLLAVAASLGLGIFLAFVREAMDNSIRNPDDIEMKLHIRLLAFLPKIKTSAKDIPMESYLSAGYSNFAEAIRSLRTGIMLARTRQPCQTVVITSSQPGEGKSTIALNLAESLGQMERVLLIEADLRRPCLAHALNLQSESPGLTNLISGLDDLKTCIRTLPTLGIDILAAGMQPGNPQELLSSQRVVLMLEVLKRHYDRIIIDTPPIQSVSDALLMSACADGVIYILKAGATDANVAADSIKRLRSIGATIIGAVLNQADLRGGRYKGYYPGYCYPSANSQPAAVASSRHNMIGPALR